jgi:hypothetical protein
MLCHGRKSRLLVTAGRLNMLQLGKIGRRRASTCLLAVVLDTESGDDAPALAALLHALPMVCDTLCACLHSDIPLLCGAWLCI